MGLILAIAAGLFAIFAACAAKVLADEFKAWAPFLTEKIIAVAVRAAPEHLRSRLAEEWLSHVNDTPGDLGKLYSALGFIWASGRLRQDAELGMKAEKQSIRDVDDEQFLREMADAIAELNDDPRDRYTDPNAYPAHCAAARDGRHNVPGAALYFSERHGAKTFHGSCALCGQWIDTGELFD